MLNALRENHHKRKDPEANKQDEKQQNRIRNFMTRPIRNHEKIREESVSVAAPISLDTSNPVGYERKPMPEEYGLRIWVPQKIVSVLEAAAKAYDRRSASSVAAEILMVCLQLWIKEHNQFDEEMISEFSAAKELSAGVRLSVSDEFVEKLNGLAKALDGKDAKTIAKETVIAYAEYWKQSEKARRDAVHEATKKIKTNFKIPSLN